MMSWSRRRYGAALSASLAVASAAQATEASLAVTIVPELRWSNSSSVFDQPSLGLSFGRDSGRADVEVQWRSIGVNLVATGRASVREGERAQYTGIVNELYWDGHAFDQHITVGKKIMSWDVGFGFRPLDVLQRDDRRVLFASTYEGVPVIAWERFTESSAWTVAYANPGAGRGGSPRDDESLAARYYRHVENIDFYAIGRVSKRLGLEAGVAASYVAKDSLELHGSLRYQRRLDRTLNRDAEEQVILPGNAPFLLVTGHDRLTALAGATWTHASGLSVLGEWWYDPAGYSASEWRNLFALMRGREELPQSAGAQPEALGAALAAGTQYLERPNLLRQNLLLRISHQRETFQRSLDVLWTPEDGGIVATLSLAYGWNRQHVSAGLRAFGGAPDAVYRALPEDTVLFCAWGISW